MVEYHRINIFTFEEVIKKKYQKKLLQQFPQKSLSQAQLTL